MSLKKVPTGSKAPEVFNVVIEISANSLPIKYEVDEETGVLFVDRFMGTSMSYPLNYGFIPQTLGEDGDPLDVLVYTPFPLPPGVVVPCRVLGMLDMDDEAGGDSKLIAVPTEKILPHFKHIQKIEDMGELLIKQVQHFFEHYKDLEAGKWVKVKGWQDAAAAKAEISRSIERAK